ncbi:AraC family transcriptional regulator [Paenibacillus sp. J5C_2022]|uniref:AraC family transcriptional regulator n=1 Tax=Paenibacillus sp. J5C2022 TaxID=2977129 RepID=UPI0021CE28BA|nr:AraC family transcriptional regulator [Paenibacillus sp. J5C2022]MCU6709122.1 AraC family transcriptional regulator [Paenibacillus sp. J5C2022]
MMRRPSLKQKIWLSYGLMFAVPFLILGSIVYYSMVINLQREIEKSNIRQLGLVRDEMDSLMQEMDTLATQLSLDPKLTPYLVSKSGYSLLETVRELNRYQSYNPHLEDILIYYYGDPNIYSTTGTMSVDILSSEFYSFPDRNLSDWLERSDVQPASSFIKAINLKDRTEKKRDSNLIAYVSPIPRSTFLHYGKAVLMLNGDSLTNQIDKLLGDLRGSIFVLDESRQVMAYKNNSLPVGQTIISDVWQSDWSPGLRQIHWKKESYSLAYAKSERTGWSYVTLMPTKQFLSRVIDMKMFVWIVLGMMVCLGFVGSLVISRRQYRPIGSLFQSALTIRSGSSGHRLESELDFIGTTLQTTYRNNLELIEQVDLQKEIVKEKFFLNVLEGKLELQELEDGIKTYNLKLQGNLFFVLTVDLENGPDDLLSADKKEEISSALNHFTVDRGTAYGVMLDWETRMALIISVEHEEDEIRQVQLNVVRKLQRLTAERVGTPLTLAVGQAYKQLHWINRSFIEASGAMAFKLREGSGSLIFFDEIENSLHDDLWYPVEEQVRFVQSLRQGDAEIASETLQRIIASIAEREQSMLMLRLICSDLINSVFKTMREMGFVDISDQIRMVAKYASLNDLAARLRQVVEDICEHVVHNRESNNTRLRDAVIAEINERYPSLDFSLEQLAMHFRLSSSYLSRFIKEQTGMTFTDYVQHLRQNEVKRLLVETDMPVKEIVGRVGYIGVSKYIEKFRKQEGITPGQYRKLYKKK